MNIRLFGIFANVPSRIDTAVVVLGLVLALMGFSVYLAATIFPDCFSKQLSHILLALVLLMVAKAISPQLLYGSIIPLYILTIALLVLVALFGVNLNGSQRWLKIAGFSFQPSEMLKISLPLMLMALARKAQGYRYMVQAIGVIAIPVTLVYFQPDLGTAFYCLLVALICLLIIGKNARHLGYGVLLIAITLPLLFWGLHDYQKARITTFLSSPDGWWQSYIQSLIAEVAIRNGQLWGSAAADFDLISSQHLMIASSDFIFAVIGERFGFVTTAGVLLNYFAICWSCIKLVTPAREPFANQLRQLFASSLALAVFINCAMVMGLLPVVGVPLPFLSFGGTNLMVFASYLGLTLNRQLLL